MVSPGGKFVADHVYGPRPLLALNVVAGYATPTVQSGSVPPSIVGGGWIVRARSALALAPAWSVTVTVTVNGPPAVGVPPIVPVVALMFIPAGRPLADHEYGSVP